MRTARLLAALALLGGLFLGCGQAPPAPVPTGTKDIAGTVTDVATNMPLEGATAQVPGQNLTATTDANGSYTLTGIPEQALEMAFSAAGYETATVAVTAAQTTVDAALSASGTAVVNGRVTDSFGQGVSSARVSVEGSTSASQTDPSGSYRLVNVPGGLRTITASAGGYKTQRRNITVDVGRTVAVNFRLDQSPNTISVRGRVTDAVSGEAVTGARVDVAGQVVLTDTDGFYLITDVTGTSVAVTVSADNYITGSATVSISGTDNVANFALIPTETGGPPGPPG